MLAVQPLRAKRAELLFVLFLRLIAMTNVSLDRQRVYFRFLMDLARVLATAKREQSPPRPDRLLVLCAVALGTIEGRPFRVAKLAEYLGMPRTSVLRRLEELEAEDWITYSEKGHVLTRPERLAEPQISAVCDTVSTLIHRAHRELLEIEQKENKTVQIGH